MDALAAWAAGIAAITAGAMEQAVERLDKAAAIFTALGEERQAAATRVSTMIALGTLGRYDEAAACGLRARDLFLAHGDALAAGKVEQNLGVLAWRRDRYQEAEQLHRSARERFAAAGEVELLVAAENALAADLAPQFRLREAAERYERALSLAEAAGLAVRQAEIECNLGNLALAQGRYDRALDYLERSRRRYAGLGMPHESAYAELELAEAYLSLNMAAEAAAICGRVSAAFAALGMRAEQAWALAQHGQAAVLLGQPEQAAARFAAARPLFETEGNAVGAALLALHEAELAHQRGEHAAALAALAPAEELLAAAGSHGRALLARWLRGEALRALGRPAEARALLESALAEAERRRLPQIALRCLTSLGLLAAAAGEARLAEATLERAAAIGEGLRAPLPSEEFRAAFVADKLTPYSALMRLCLEDTPPRPAAAFAHAERARARALVELLGRTVEPLAQPRDAFEAELAARISALREELNYGFTQLTQALSGLGPAAPDQLQADLEAREAAILELQRQLEMRGQPLPGQAEPLDLPGLQRDLAQDTALVAYASLDGEILAFVVSDSRVEVARGLVAEDELAALIGQMRFQIEARGRAASLAGVRGEQLLRRSLQHLQRLYRLLIAPLEPWIGERRLVVVPSRSLHYLPFHALHDGAGFLIERREVLTAPSAGLLRHCLGLPRRGQRRALLVGAPDERAPRVRDELLALAPLCAEPTLLLGEAARAAELRRLAPAADLLHLACHGTFRPESPLFSALQLADGPFTVRDAYALQLRCDLVVLSACETGVSAIAPGDELIGLARGFFAAGAPALIVSLWMVDDDSAAALMGQFYARLRAGDRPARALRAAQQAMIAADPHPFLWAPFILMGRW